MVGEGAGEEGDCATISVVVQELLSVDSRTLLVAIHIDGVLHRDVHAYPVRNGFTSRIGCWALYAFT